MNKIRKGDEVIVITGKDKGKRGIVTQRVSEAHLLVEGVNMAEPNEKYNRRYREQNDANRPVEHRDL
jgi:large subunit ribosomal protein L24